MLTVIPAALYIPVIFGCCNGATMAVAIWLSLLITAWQAYWFRCNRCGREAPLGEPHWIERRFALMQTRTETGGHGLPVWRYSLKKHGVELFLNLNRVGYVADSAQLGFGPWEGDAKELNA